MTNYLRALHNSLKQETGGLINAVEAFIAKADGRNDTPYIATVSEFEDIVTEE